MRKIVIYISTVLIFLALIVMAVLGGIADFPLIITLSVFFLLFISYFYFERSSMGTKEIALIATLSAFAGVGRVVMVFIPGAQPTTFIVALSGLIFGPYEGFLVGSTSAFISNIFLGQGPWSPWQMFGWGIVGFISGLIGKKGKEISVEKFSVICFLYGFLFDWIMNLWHVLGFIKTLTLKSIAAAYISGLTFDVIHALGNFIFSLILFERLSKVLYRFKRRLEITYIK